MADEVEGLGRLDDPVKAVEGIDWSRLSLSAQEGFVFSRVDGITSARLLCQMTGLGVDPTLSILRQLRQKGVIVLGNQAPIIPPPPANDGAAEASPPPTQPEETQQAKPNGASAAASERTASTPSNPAVAVPKADEEPEEDPWLLVEFEQEEAEGIDLKRSVRSMVRRIHTRLDDMTFFELLGVPLDADEKSIRRAYFKASKQFHPDRYYTKKLGPYKDWLARIFKQVKAAYEFLQDAGKRDQYRRMILQERENERISRDLAEQVAQVASDLQERLSPKAETLESPEAPDTGAETPADQPVVGAGGPATTGAAAATGQADTERQPLPAEQPEVNDPTAQEPAAVADFAPHEATAEVPFDAGADTPADPEPMGETAPTAPEVPEADEPPRERRHPSGVAYSIVKPRSARVAAPKAPAADPSPADRGEPGSSPERSDTAGSDEAAGSAQADAPPTAPPRSGRSPTLRRPGRPSRPSRHTARALEEDDPERAERRKHDRVRRSRLTATNPVLMRKAKAKTFYEQGLGQLEQGKSLAAAASLKLAMTYDESMPEYRTLYEEAVEASRASTAEGFFKRAIFEESVGRYETAGRLYQRAADILPKATYLQRAADSLTWSGDLAKAKEYATQAVQIEPNSVEARLTLAQIYLTSKLKKNARREVDMALKIEPNNPDAKELLKKIKRG